MPAASVVQLVLEKVPVDNAAVDEPHREFFGALSVTGYEMPSMAGDVAVDTRHGRLPVLCFGDGALDAVAVMEPVERAENRAKTEEEVG